jgi:hypothetical protein
VCATALLPATGETRNSAQTVYAAWSQIIGETSVAAPHLATPPTVQLRWVIDHDGACGAFAVSDKPAGQDGTIVGLNTVDHEWASGPLNKTTCFFEIPTGWSEVHLIENGAAVRLTSKISYSDQSADPSGWIWQEGPSNNQPVIVKGPAWIGAGDALTMVTLGDTGCRGFPQGVSERKQQNCENKTGESDWPLATLAQAAAGHRTDMVIHVGDYRYYYEDEIDQDSWDLWQKDFFPAAQPLLLAAPWVFVRGNHEGCPGADLPYGVGYFQFFGTKADASCDALADAGKTYMQPWFFDIGTGADAHRTVVLDVSAFTSEGAVVPEATANFEAAAQMSASGPESSWWAFHTPGVQLTYYSGEEHTGEPSVTQALLDATGQATLLKDRFCGHDGEHACKPSQFLMGHQHLFQSVTFPQPGKDWTFPRQMIVGHGGTKVDTANPAPSGETCHYSHFPIGSNGEDVSGYAHTDQRHGLVLWTRDQAAQAGWIGAQIFASDPGALVPIRIKDAGSAPSCYLD